MSSSVPEHAVECYKTVAVVGGRLLSIYDGVTEYQLHRATHLRHSSLWVCPDLFSLMVHAAQLPSRSVLLDCPRVVLRCLCWNEDGSPPTPSRRSALKLRVSHLLPTAVLPYGAEPLPTLAPPTEPPPAVPSGGRRPRSAASGLPSVEAMPPGLALRTYGGGVPRGAMLQAATTRLADDVVQMEATLRSAQQLGASARGAQAEDRPQSAWMRRALASLA